LTSGDWTNSSRLGRRTETRRVCACRQPRVILQPGTFSVISRRDVWVLDLASGNESKLVENVLTRRMPPTASHSCGRVLGWPPPHLGARQRRPQPQQVRLIPARKLPMSRARPLGLPMQEDRLSRTSRERSRYSLVSLESKQMNWITKRLLQQHTSGVVIVRQVIYFSSYPEWRYKHLANARQRRWNSWGPLQQVTTGAGQDVEGRHLTRWQASRLLPRCARMPTSGASGPSAKRNATRIYLEALISTTRE